MRNQACSGTDKLNKKAFLSMIGAKRYIQQIPVVSFSEEQKARVLEVLKQNSGDLRRAAIILGMSVSTLKRKLDRWKTYFEPINEEPASPTPSRRYFENLSVPWGIRNFDAQKREVCVELNAPAGKVVLSVQIPNQKR